MKPEEEDAAEDLELMLEEEVVEEKIDIENDRYPYCIVWSPIPVLTWFFPFIGHMGLANSKGIIFDFAGPYTINHDNFAFGRPTRYLQLVPTKGWDEALSTANAIYAKRMHNLCCDNCHSHVAVALEGMKYNGKTRYDMVSLCFWMFFTGSYTDFNGFVSTWLGFVVLGTILIISSIVL